MKAVVVLSGGMDSTAALYWTRWSLGDQNEGIHCLSFDYGQRHVKELRAAAYIAAEVGAMHTIVDLSNIQTLVSASVLTDQSREVPEGHYASENMQQTVVPNRNSIMMNIAAGAAITFGAELLVTGVHAGDHAVYPDCRPEFITRLEELLLVANEGFIHEDFRVEAPWLYKTKEDIVFEGESLGVPWIHTWTCYKGGDIHCGRCATCVERLEAMHGAGTRLGYTIADVAYEDEEYWRRVIDEAAT